MKIAMIGHKRIPSREGGVERVVEELAVRMAEKGYKVCAYNRKGHHVSGKENDVGKQKAYKGVRIITVPTVEKKSLNAVVYSFLATIHALFGHYDVIHFHAEGPCAFLWLPRLFRIKVVATIHGLDWQRAKWGGFATWFLKHGEKTAAKYANAIIVLSPEMQRYFKQTYNRETVYIPNGIDKADTQKPKIIKEKYGLSGDDYLLFLARIVPEKGLHYLIEAYQKSGCAKKLVIAGGSSHSFEYMEKVKKMAAKDKRILMTDFVQGRVLEELYSNAYIFVLPSDIEGMAISLLEAMSYGNCCLVSDIRENLEVVETKAVTFVKSDAEDLKNKLKELLNNPEIVDKYKNESSSFICEKYNWNDVLEQTLALYQK